MKHLLTTRELDRATAVRILDVAEEMAATADREVKKRLEYWERLRGERA